MLLLFNVLIHGNWNVCLPLIQFLSVFLQLDNDYVILNIIIGNARNICLNAEKSGQLDICPNVYVQHVLHVHQHVLHVHVYDIQKPDSELVGSAYSQTSCTIRDNLHSVAWKSTRHVIPPIFTYCFRMRISTLFKKNLALPTITYSTQSSTDYMVTS